MAKKLAGVGSEMDSVISQTSQNQELSRLQKQNRQLQEIVDRQSEALEAKAKKVKLNPGSKGRARGTFIRLCIPDTHGSKIARDSFSRVLRDASSMDVREVVLLGDHADVGGFLAQHHTLGYVSECDYTYEQDIAEANGMLDSIAKACPKAEIHYLEGNHEARAEKWCVTQALRGGVDANYLLQMISPQKLMHLEKRNIKYYRMGEFHQGLHIRGTIKLGKCYFTHGSTTSKHAASKMVDMFGGNVVFGHIHRAQSHLRRTVHEGVLGAWCPGCLCQIQPTWMHTTLTDWSHGYGLQVVQASGEFLHINVPIVDGASLLEPLLKAIKC